MAFRHAARRGHTHDASSGELSIALDDLSDVTITSVASNDLIQYNGSAWVNIPASTVIGTVDHGALSGLSDDDHPQYGHLSQDETIVGHWTATDRFTINGAIPYLKWTDSDAVTDAGTWFLGATASNKMVWELRSDDLGTSTPFMEITRATTTADKIDFRNLTDINLDLGLAISWEGSDSVDYEYAVVESSTVALDSDEYYSSTKVTSTSTTYVDITGATMDVSTLSDGDVYMVVAHAHVGNNTSGAVDSNGVQVIGPAGTTLSGSEQLFESTGYSVVNSNNFGDPYGYMGWFTNDVAGTDVHMEYKKSSGGGSTVFANRIGMFVLNLTDLANHQKVEDTGATVLDGSDEGSEVSTSAALTLAAGDWLIFSSAQFGNFSGGASEFEYVLHDGTTTYKQSGGYVQDTANDKWSVCSAFILDSYAGGTVTLKGHIYGGVNGADITRAALVAIPLSDFTEAAWSQNASTTPALDDGTGNNTVCETVNIASVTNAGSWMVLGWGCAQYHGGSPTMGFDTQEDVNSGGAATIGGDLTMKTNLIGPSEAYQCDLCIANAKSSYSASDQVTLTTRYDVNGTTNNWYFLHEGLVAFFMQAGSADTLYVGHASHGPTVIQGTATNVTSASTDVDGTLNVDGAATLQSTAVISGAATLSSTLDVTGAITGNSTLRLPAVTDVSLASSDHPFQIGTTASTNLRMDMNEIMAVDNGAASTLHLNADGGAVRIGNNTAGSLEVANGSTLDIFDATDADSISFAHDGTNATATMVGATRFDFVGLAGGVGLRGGAGLVIFDSTNADSVNWYHDGTDANFEFVGTTDLNINSTTGVIFNDGYIQQGDHGSACAVRLDRNDGSIQIRPTATTGGWARGFVAVADSSSTRLGGIGFFGSDEALTSIHIGIGATWWSTNEVAEFTSSYVGIKNGTPFRVYDGGDTDYVQFDHDGTDLNMAGTNTTDWNISGFTTIQAGAVNADFAAITATSYGGITEANLLDKSAVEQISGAWVMTSDLTFNMANGYVNAATDAQNFAIIFGATYSAASNPYIRGYGGSAASNAGLLTYSVPPGGQHLITASTNGDVLFGSAITHIKANQYIQLHTATDTQLNDVTHAINTAAGKIQGAMVYNTTQDVPVYAVGNADASVWVDGAGTTVNTPV